MLSTLKLGMQRKATERFIAADPSVIDLGFKTVMESNGTKSYAPGGQRGEQIFKII